MNVFRIALLLMLAGIVSSPAVASAEGKGNDQLRPAVLQAQRSESSATDGQGPSPAIDLSPGGASIEDLLLPKGTIPTNE